jgi:hypothetical protein
LTDIPAPIDWHCVKCNSPHRRALNHNKPKKEGTNEND